MSEQLAFTVNMYQSSTRKNFLDILADPIAIAILGSIALHAILATSVPLFNQPAKEGKKAGPTTVKVVQLTPNELQRIPQAPPTPVPQPAVTQPAPAPRPSVAPTTPQFSTAPQTIPFSPVRTPNTTKPPSGKKEQKAAQPKQTTSAIFDPDAVFKPTPTPTKPPAKKGNTPKKTVVTQQSPPPKTQSQPKQTKTTTAPTPQPTPATGEDGTDPSTTAPTTAPNPQTQQPPSTQQTTPQSNPTQPTQSTTPPAGSPTGNGGNGFYGKYTDAAIKQLTLYMEQYGVKEPYPPKTLTLRYPQGMVCAREKQAPLIVIMAVFDKFPDNKEEAILGTSSATSLDVKVFKDKDTPDLEKLGEIAARAAIDETSQADRSRAEKDKGKRVIHQYIVKFDPETCKK